MTPREEWGDGPWQTEPDRIEWRHEPSGYPLLLARGYTGAWCGYVGLPPGHAFYGKSHTDIEVEAHGGLTYSGPCSGAICHVPEPGEPDDVWWLGFDCSHCYDIAPAQEAFIGRIKKGSMGAAFPYAKYRTADEVQAMVEALALELRPG